VCWGFPFRRIFRNMDYWIELKRLLFKLFRITKFRTRSDKSIRSSILSKIKELTSHFARCGQTTFSSVFFPFYVILYRIRKEHYSSTYLLLYHCANDWFFGQLHKWSQVGQIYTVINIIKIKELASHFARCGLTDRSVAIQILTLLMW
jgi:hypothetical protein